MTDLFCQSSVPANVSMICPTIDYCTVVHNNVVDSSLLLTITLPKLNRFEWFCIVLLRINFLYTFSKTFHTTPYVYIDYIVKVKSKQNEIGQQLQLINAPLIIATFCCK